MRLGWLAALALALVTTSAAAGKPDRKAEANKLVESWKKLGLWTQMLPVHSGDNPAECFTRGDVIVTEKWAKLPLDRQTKMVETMGILLIDAFEGHMCSDSTQMRLMLSSQQIGTAEVWPNPDETAVSWDDWYVRTLLAKRR